MRKLIFPVSVLLLAAAVAGCGGGDGGTTPTGTAQISLTDAPAADLDNVPVTLKAVWFHASDASGPWSSLRPPRTTPT